MHEIEGAICPKRPYLVEGFSVVSGEVFVRQPASCDAYLCPICGPRKAEQAAAVFTWAIREAARRETRCRLVTFTLAPSEFQRTRQKVRNVRRWALDQGWQWEMGWCVEVGKQTGMVHVHGIQHGPQKVPQRALQARWGAHVDIRAIKTPAAGLYAAKEALRVAGYVSKGAPAGLAAHLDRNGGRAAHWTRGFLHGLTKREALAEVRKEQANSGELAWRLVPAWRPA